MDSRLNKQKSDSQPREAKSTSETSADDVAIPVPTFADFSPEHVLHLQRTIGNRAVARLLQARQAARMPLQRLVMSEPMLREQAGEPRENKGIGTPFGKLDLWRMSKQYKKILAEIKEYYDALKRTQVSNGNSDLAKQKVLVNKLLSALEESTTRYLKDHAKDYQEAHLIVQNALNNSQEDVEEAKIEIKRNAAITTLAQQITQDQQTINGVTTAAAGKMWIEVLMDPNLSSANTLNANALQGNPRAPANTPNFQFGQPTFDQGVQPGGLGGGGGLNPVRYETVQILHDSNNPLRQLATPTDAQLFTGVQNQVNAKNKRFVQNTTANPQIEGTLGPASLFIGADPDLLDVAQGGIGDCYLLAALMTIINTDKDRLKRMMTMTHNEFSVDFFRFDKRQDIWIPQRVKVPLDLGIVNNMLKGSRFRIGTTVLNSDWYVQDSNPHYFIKRRNQYETAMWVPLLEKAYLSFVQTYGKYGGFDFWDAPSTDSGYDIASAGDAFKTFGLFYGPALLNAGSQHVEYDQTKDPKKNVSINPNLLNALLDFKRSLTQPANQFNKLVHLTAYSPPQDHIARGLDVVAAILSSSSAQGHAQNTLTAAYGNFVGELKTLSSTLKPYKYSFNSKAPQDTKTVKDAATNFLKAVNWNALLTGAPNQTRVFQDLRELTTNLVNIGTDTSDNQRNIYSAHGYALLNVVFRDDSGTEITDLGKVAKNIDPLNTTITLRNPHGKNTPDLTGTNPSGQQGVFELKLDQFMQSFANINFGIAQR